VRYVRNAAEGAEVRYLGEPAQGYVTAVFRAWGDYGKALDAPDIAIAGDLWPKDSDNWNTSGVLDARVAALRTLLGMPKALEPQAEPIPPAEGATPAAEPRPEDDSKPISADPAAALAVLEKAIDDVPAEFSAAADLPARIRAALHSVPDVYAESVVGWEESARLQLELCEWVKSHAAEFDEAAVGLVFGRPELNQEAQSRWAVVQTGLRAARAAAVAAIEARISRIKETDMAAVLKEKQALRRGDLSIEANLRRYRNLELDMKLLDQRAKTLEALLRTLKAREQEADAAKGDESPPG